MTWLSDSVVAVAAIPFEDPTFWSGDPYPTFARLRAEDPVHRHESPTGAFWAIARHADVQAISKDPATFQSGKGVRLEDRGRPVDPSMSIIYQDPPLHAKRRKLVSPSLTVRRVADLEPRVRAITVELLDGLPVDEPFDAVDELSAPVPMRVIAELIGVPTADLADFRRWSDAIIEAASEMAEDTMAMVAELFVYVGGIVAQRRQEPQDDLVSVLAHGTVDGEALSDDDINAFVMTLLVAGNETTRTLLSHSLIALAEHPDQRAALAADPSGTATAVEELLRWEPPIMTFCRTATRDTTVGDTPIAAGDYLLLLYQSANRDEEVFGPTADRVDLTRSPNPHVTFGYGEHFCMGAGLARLEARVVLEELLARWPAYELAGPFERQPSLLARGISRLPVVLRA